MIKEDAKLSKTDLIGSLDDPFRVGVFAVPGFALMSYASTVEPLRAANLLSRRPLYEVVHFGEAPLSASSGTASVERQAEVGAALPLNMLLVVAGGDPFAYRNARVFAWLSRLARAGVTIGGVSGGAVILANAGLMGGRRLTVHWEHAAALAERFPDLAVERRLYVIDRDRVTCGGGTAPMDLMHALITQHHGGAFARLVSDWFLHTDIRGAAAPQRSGLGAQLGGHSPHIGVAVAAMESHIGDPLSLAQLALVAQVSPRHLNRVFSEAFDQSVMDYYREMRLETGRRLLRSTSMGVGEIAQATGFSNAGHFSNAYLAQFGVRPQKDRNSPMVV